MSQSKALEILKSAILMEKRGKAFYELMANQTKSEQAKKVFSIMAEEESAHIDFLATQYKSLVKDNKFVKTLTNAKFAENIAAQVITEEFKSQVSAASFEAAAISAAIDFESRSVDLYQARAVEASDPAEKELYAWLADWERGHHALLLKLDEELKESIWFDNQFWPF